MDFLRFIQYYKSQTPNFWDTHTLDIDEAENIKVLKSRLIDQKKIIQIFQKNLPLLEERLKEDPELRASLVSIVTSIEKDLKVNLSSVFSASVFAKVLAGNNLEGVAEIPLSLNAIKYSEVLRNNFIRTAFRQESALALRFPFKKEEIESYFFYSQNRHKLPKKGSAENIISALMVAKYLLDVDLEEKLTPCLAFAFDSLSKRDFLGLCKKVFKHPSFYLDPIFQEMLADSVNRRAIRKESNPFLFYLKFADFLGEGSLNVSVLNLRGCKVSYSFLINLSSLFPMVEELKISDPTSIVIYVPENWKKSLRILDVSGSKRLRSILQFGKLFKLETLRAEGTLLPQACS